MALSTRLVLASGVLVFLGCGDVQKDDPTLGNALPAALEDEGNITALAIRGENGMVTNSFDVESPITVTIALQPTRTAHDHPVYVGLVEKLAPGAEHSTAMTCLLGGFEALYAQDPNNPDQPTTFTQDFKIPADCLKDGDTDRTFNLWVALNPALNDGTDMGNMGHVSSKDYNTQFFNDAQQDLDGKDRNKLCIGEDGNPGCIIDITVKGSPGHNLEFQSLQPDSSVAVLPADCLLDHANPPLSVNGTVLIFGSRPEDGHTLGQDPINALKVAGGANATATVTYQICPAGDKPAGAADTDPAPCATGTTYTTVYMLGNSMTDTNPVDNFTVDTMVSGEPSEFHHQLYMPPASEACLRITGQQTAMEDWSSYGAYNLKSCINTTSFTEAREGGHELDDNCQIVPIHIVVTPPTPPPAANSYSLAKSWSTSFGGSVVGLAAALSTSNQLTLSGAFFSANASSDLTGWLSTNLFRAKASASAYVAIVGSGVSLSLDIFNTRIWGYDKSIDVYSNSWDQNFSKQACGRYNYGVAGLGLNASFCATGSAGIKSTLDIFAKNGAGAAPFDTSTKIGQANGTATPYVTMQLSASAWADIGVANGGINGNLTLFNGQLPITGQLQWGLTQVSPPQLFIKGSTTMGLSLTLLSGYIHGWAEVWQPDWCDCGSWCPGYPCGSWSTVWDSNLFWWWGWYFYQQLFNLSSQMYIQ